jgi:glucose-1-phosphate cytidylyltransferase
VAIQQLTINEVGAHHFAREKGQSCHRLLTCCIFLTVNHYFGCLQHLPEQAAAANSAAATAADGPVATGKEGTRQYEEGRGSESQRRSSMKVVILAGGLGTRIAEETNLKPKPMIEIGGKPILWHIMNIYSHFGFNDFLIACGYRGDVIKDYFSNFYIHNSDWIVDLRNGTQQVVHPPKSQWRVGVLDTGLHTATGGRLLRLKEWIGHQTFLLTYGDGVADVNIASIIAFHRAHGRLFSEKPQTEQDWINGGFFVFEPGVLGYIAGDATSLERDPLERLAKEGQLMAYCHKGFWQPMDTLREKQLLESLWERGKAPWKLWEDRQYDAGRVLSAEERVGNRPLGVQGNVAYGLA